MMLCGRSALVASGYDEPWLGASQKTERCFFGQRWLRLRGGLMGKTEPPYRGARDIARHRDQKQGHGVAG